MDPGARNRVGVLSSGGRAMTEVRFPSADVRRALYLSAILELWRKGFDTAQIAKTIGDTEASVERSLHEAMNERRRQHEGQG